MYEVLVAIAGCVSALGVRRTAFLIAILAIVEGSMRMFGI